jgi:hypothetical protein
MFNVLNNFFQLIVLRSHIVQIVVHPNNKKLSSKTIGKLIRMLRSLNLIWQSYLNHLPLSGGHLYPKALEQGKFQMYNQDAVTI